MDRRGVLAGLAAGLSGVAGCLGGSAPRAGGSGPGDPREGSGVGERSDGPGSGDTGGRFDLPVPESELVRAAPVDGIPAIVDPAFAPEWGEFPVTVRDPQAGTYETTVTLDGDDRVIGVERGGRARAYPLKVLNYHEVVNDDLGGPLLVTYCPLCRSGVTAERLASGTATTFGVSGLLWRANLVLYDEHTDSLWSQIEATAIRGPATGQRLSLVPSTLTTVAEWRASHPDAEFLLPPPASGTVIGEYSFHYDRDPYAGYAASTRVGASNRSFGDDRLHPKTLVLGVSHGTASVAYPVDAVRAAGVVNDRVGDLPVVVATTDPDGADGEGTPHDGTDGGDATRDGDPATDASGGRDPATDASADRDPGADGGVETTPARERGTLAAYVRRVDGRVRRFERADAIHLRAAGSRWSIATGRAVDGPHEGTRLRAATDLSPMFWFAWLDFRPGTTVYGR